MPQFAERHSGPLYVWRRFIRYRTTGWDTTTLVAKSIHFTRFFSFKNMVQLRASLFLQHHFTFRMCKAHPKHACTRLYGREKTMTFLGLHYMELHRPHILCSSVDQVSVLLFLRKDRAASTVVPVIRFKGKVERGLLWRTPPPGELGWRTIVGTNSASANRIKRLYKWNVPPFHIISKRQCEWIPQSAELSYDFEFPVSMPVC